MVQAALVELPGLDCGMCGYRTCDELRERLPSKPDLIRRCIHLSDDRAGSEAKMLLTAAPSRPEACETIVWQLRENGSDRRTAPSRCSGVTALAGSSISTSNIFPKSRGREIILPHNPLITREMDVQVGDILIGRPLGMSCGCPITHCGVATEVDKRTGVIVWCVTGPLGPRQKGFKDLGYYIAEGYEGLVNEARCELKVGMRYYFQPRMCMLQWRHSGLVNYLSRNGKTYQVRVEGLWIG